MCVGGEGVVVINKSRKEDLCMPVVAYVDVVTMNSLHRLYTVPLIYYH